VSQRGNVWPDACASAIKNLRLHLLHGTVNSNDERSTPQNPRHSVMTETQSTSVRGLSTTRPRSTSTYPKETAVPLAQQPSHHASFQEAAHQQTNVIQSIDQRTVPESGPSAIAGIEGNWATTPNCASRLSTAPTISSETPTDSGSIDPSIIPPDTNLGLLQWSNYMQSNNEINEILPLPTDDSADLFAGFDIPFWLGQDEYSWMVDEWS
jgi:hypothetical protein